MWEICSGGPAESKVWGFLTERGQNPRSQRQPHRRLIPVEQPGKPLGAWPPAPPSDNMQHLPQKCTTQARPPERRAQAAEGRLPPEFLLSPDLYAH